ISLMGVIYSTFLIPDEVLTAFYYFLFAWPHTWKLQPVIIVYFNIYFTGSILFLKCRKIIIKKSAGSQHYFLRYDLVEVHI
ncbi:MAG: hypothetical protein AAB958_00065, partial [Patescibacteria group bacterium]